MNRPPHDDNDEILARAAELLTRRDAGWSADEAAEFALWRAADPRHEAAVQRLERAHRLLEKLPSSPAAAAMLDELDALGAPKTRAVPFAPWLKAAAALAAAACVAFVVWTAFAPSVPVVIASYAATAGDPRSVDLVDGSTLLLNRDSQVDIAFQADERRVTLRRGEVHFTVAHDSARPFVVSAGAVRVRAVGTAFNVNRQPGAIEVLVTEGRVLVSRDDAARVRSRDELYLGAGQGVAIDEAGGLPTVAARLSPEIMRDKLAWQSPRLEFSNTPLADVVAAFNRHNRLQLELGDPALATRPVGGTFNANNAEAFVSLLQASGDVRIERVSATRVVLHPAR